MNIKDSNGQYPDNYGNGQTLKENAPERIDDFSYRPIGNQNLRAKTEDNPNKNLSPEELLRRLYEKRIPEPTFNQDKADRLQRMGRVNQIGRGVSVLGGILATGLGAPIKRMNPDNVTPSLVQSYLDNLDKYKAEKDANILRNYQKDIEDIRTGLSHSYREQATELAKQKQADWMKAKEMDNKLSWEKWSTEWDFKNKQFEEQKRKNKENERISEIRANKAGSRSYNTQTPKNNAFPLFNDQGQQTASVPEGMEGRVLKVILDDPEFKQFILKDKNLLLAKNGKGLDRQNIRNIISYYYDKSPAAKRMLGIIEESQQKVKGKTSSFDYSKLSYPTAGEKPQQSDKKVPSFFK